MYTGENEGWNLEPLTPTFIKSEHGKYIKTLEKYLEQDGITNVALSGNYGVGKSSILGKFADNNPEKTTQISLSTFALDEEVDLDDSIPKQANTPTNIIQREIVKQFLYQETVSQSRGSRFQKIERFSWKRELLISLITGLAFTRPVK